MGEAARNLSSAIAAMAPVHREPAPSVGRIVLYVPTSRERERGGSGECWPAVVTRVWSPHCVNLHVLTDEGAAFVVTSVMLAEAGADDDRRWRWPPRA